MSDIKMVRVKVFLGDINNLVEFIAQCDRAGLVGRKWGAMMNLLGQIREEDLEALRRVPGVTKVEVREPYDGL